MRCCSKENGPVDYLITVVHRLEEDFYKLYSVVFGPDSIPANVKLVKVSKDPLILEDIVFGK